MADKRSEDTGVAPLEIIFSCSICQATITDIYSSQHSNQGFHDGRQPDVETVTKLWLTECGHLTCGKHLEGGGWRTCFSPLSSLSNSYFQVHHSIRRVSRRAFHAHSVLLIKAKNPSETCTASVTLPTADTMPQSLPHSLRFHQSVLTPTPRGIQL